ncbi:MAG: BrnA antitoxin family protein [Burkholderiales bacterium]|nr:BrnA antitoxin family protein [Burkholderiales bacterium]
MNGNKPASSATWVDPDDAPELTDEFFERADEYEGEKLIRRGRPRTDQPKLAVTVRYDADVVQAFRATGRGWQTRMNAALREWLETHPTADTND